MSNTDITDEIRQKTTEELPLFLDQSAYTWGLMEGTLIHAGPHAPTRWIRRIRDEECGDTMVAREELRNRIAGLKRSVDAGLDRERELRDANQHVRRLLRSAESEREDLRTEVERRGQVIDSPRPGDHGVVTHYRGIKLPEVVPVQWHDGAWKAQDRFEDLAPASVTVRRAEPERATCDRPCACPDAAG